MKTIYEGRSRSGWNLCTMLTYVAALVALTVGLLMVPISAIAQTTAQADLNWTDVTNETSYRVERSDDGGTTYAEVGTTAQDVTNFNDTNVGLGLALNTLYCWQVISVNSFGEAAPSSPACAEASTPDQVIGVQVIVSPL